MGKGPFLDVCKKLEECTIYLFRGFLLYPVTHAINDSRASKISAESAGIFIRIKTRQEGTYDVQRASNKATGLVHGSARKLWK